MARLGTKTGVSFNGMTARTLQAIATLTHEFHAQDWGPFVITSGSDGVHSARSKHYDGDAFDVRIWYIPKSNLKQICIEIAKILNDESPLFQVILESTHIHIEYDPIGATERGQVYQKTRAGNYEKWL